MHCLQVILFRFPVSRPEDVSSRLDAHLSTIPSVRTTCHTVRTPERPSIIRPDDVSSHLDVHLSTIPSVRTTCHTVRTPDRPSIICPDDVHSRPDHNCFEKLLFQLASIGTFQQPVRMPLNDRSTSDSFQV
jgi:ribosomal protein S19